MTQWVTAIDPGYSTSNATGWARFRDGVLVSAGISTSREPDFVLRTEEIVNQLPPGADPQGLLVVELPKIYQFANQKGDPDDVVRLAYVAGACTRIPHGKLLLPRPQDWKGGVPKGIMGERVLRRLTPAERAFFDGVRDRGGAALDAVGIGLWALGRLT